MLIDSEAVFQRADSVIYRVVVGEHLLVPIGAHIEEMARLYAINEVGAEVWGRLDGRSRVREIVDAVCDQFDVERGRAEEEVGEFLDRLLGAGLACSGGRAG